MGGAGRRCRVGGYVKCGVVGSGVVICGWWMGGVVELLGIEDVCVDV